MRVVSVETGLDDIKAHLSDCGYSVVDMSECFRPVEAVVYRGEQAQTIPQMKSGTSTTLINASGLTAEEVAAQLIDRL